MEDIFLLHLEVLYWLTYGRKDMPWAIEKQWENTGGIERMMQYDLQYTANGKIFDAFTISMLYNHLNTHHK